MKKRTICLFLAVLLLVSVMNLSVYAAGQDASDENRFARSSKLQIASVELIGFQLPQAGQTAGDQLKDVTVAADAGYYISSLWWTEANSGAILSAEDSFIPGYEYSLGGTLFAKDGYVFHVPALGYETKNGMILSYTQNRCDITGRTIRIAADENTVTDLAIDGYTYPCVGQTAGENLQTVSASANAGGQPLHVLWMQMRSGEFAPIDDTVAFAENQTYALCAEYQAGIDGAFIAQPYLKVNGVCTAPWECTVEADTACTVVLFPTEAITDSNVSQVTIDGYHAPQAGQTAGENLQSLQIRAQHSTEMTAGWAYFDANGDYYQMLDSDIFCEGRIYQLEGRIIAENGYTFFENTQINVQGDVCASAYGESNADVYSFFVMAYPLEGVTDCLGDETYCALRDYNDAPAYGTWAHSGIEYCISRGVMGSTQELGQSFDPDGPCTRAMVAAMLYSIEGQPDVSYQAKFPDVQADEWYADAVMWVYQSGVMAGYGNGSFGPDDRLTREQMAVVLKAYTEKVAKQDTSKTADLSVFQDAAQLTWSKPAVSWAVAEKLISGKTQNGKVYLDPQGKASRAEVAVISMQFVENIVEELVEDNSVIEVPDVPNYPSAIGTVGK